MLNTFKQCTRTDLIKTSTFHECVKFNKECPNMSVMLMSFDGFMAQLKNHALLISIFVPNAIKSRQLLVEISAEP